jgi:hypothetical protein
MSRVDGEWCVPNHLSRCFPSAAWLGLARRNWSLRARLRSRRRLWGAHHRLLGRRRLGCPRRGSGGRRCLLTRALHRRAYSAVRVWRARDGLGLWRWHRALDSLRRRDDVHPIPRATGELHVRSTGLREILLQVTAHGWLLRGARARRSGREEQRTERESKGVWHDQCYPRVAQKSQSSGSAALANDWSARLCGRWRSAPWCDEWRPRSFLRP